MIFGERVRQAREFQGLTQTELAVQLGLGQSTLNYIENDRVEPSSDVVEAISLRTGFPPSFFAQPPEEFSEGSLLFRAKAARSARVEKRARRAAQIGFYLMNSLLRRMKPLPVRIPSLSDDPATCATATRVSMGLSPDQPIANLVNAIERIGVIVIALPHMYEDIDAFSLWSGIMGEQPIIAMGRIDDMARMRWSMAHELGHLVMHRSFGRNLATLEDEAHMFAGELLMPEIAAREELRAPMTLSSAALLKPHWKLSIQAIVMRAYHLGIITQRQRTYLFQQLTRLGWRLREPANLDVPDEYPRALPQLAEMLYGSPVDYIRLASDTHLTASIVRAYLEAAQGMAPEIKRGQVLQLANRRRTPKPY